MLFRSPAIHSPPTTCRPSPSYPDSASTLRRSLHPLSRPSSPMTNIRPPSRSEKMLRETLRRAEEHDRANISPFFLSTPLKEDDDSDCDCEDLDVFFGHTVAVNPSRSRPTRNSSTDQKRSVSPTPQRASLRRTSIVSSNNEDVLTPHDAVLKRRLEGVLSQARDQDRGKPYRSISRPRAHTRESSEDWNVRP